MVDRVAVIGAGSWGTTVAAMVSRRTPTVLWARRKELAEEIATDHQSRGYLPGFQLSLKLEATSSLEEAVTGADLIVMGVPYYEKYGEYCVKPRAQYVLENARCKVILTRDSLPQGQPVPAGR